MAKTKAKVKKKAPPPKNVGGRPRKDPEQKARRLAIYLPGVQFQALLGRAVFLKTEPQRGPNEGRGRTQQEEEDAIVAAYAKSALQKLADGILKAQS